MVRRQWSSTRRSRTDITSSLLMTPANICSPETLSSPLIRYSRIWWGDRLQRWWGSQRYEIWWLMAVLHGDLSACGTPRTSDRVYYSNGCVVLCASPQLVSGYVKASKTRAGIAACVLVFLRYGLFSFRRGCYAHRGEHLAVVNQRVSSKFNSVHNLQKVRSRERN